MFAKVNDFDSKVKLLKEEIDKPRFTAHENVELQQVSQELQDLRREVKTAQDAVMGMQVIMREFARTVPAKKEIQAEIQAAVSKMQLETLKDVQIGDKSGQEQVLKMVDYLVKATETHIVKANL